MSTPSRAMRSESGDTAIDEDERQPIHEAIDGRPARLGEAETDVEEHERGDRDERRPDRKVVADQRLLRRVADHHDQYQIEARHLRQRSLARQAKDNEQEAVEDGDAKERTGDPRNQERR